MQPVTYHDPEQYRLAAELWRSHRELFEKTEAERIVEVHKKIDALGGGGDAWGCLSLLMMVAAWYLADRFGAILGVILVSVFGGAWAANGWVVGIVVYIAACTMAVVSATAVNRWRYRKELLPRTFDEPAPVYVPRVAEPERPHQEAPPPKQEPPPKPEPKPEPPKPDLVKITSVRQAIEVLGLEPKTTVSQAKSRYRELMAQYHPDKVSHLGPELRALAAKKALLFNLAMDFLSKNAKAAPKTPPKKAEPPPTQTLQDMLKQLRAAVPFVPFAVEVQKTDNVTVTRDRLFIVPFSEWVFLLDDPTRLLGGVPYATWMGHRESDRQQKSMEYWRDYVAALSISRIAYIYSKIPQTINW